MQHATMVSQNYGHLNTSNVTPGGIATRSQKPGSKGVSNLHPNSTGYFQKVPVTTQTQTTKNVKESDNDRYIMNNLYSRRSQRPSTKNQSKLQSSDYTPTIGAAALTSNLTRKVVIPQINIAQVDHIGNLVVKRNSTHNPQKTFQQSNYQMNQNIMARKNQLVRANQDKNLQPAFRHHSHLKGQNQNALNFSRTYNFKNSLGSFESVE